MLLTSHLKDRGYKGGTSVNAGPSVVRQQCSISVVESNITLMDTMDRADETSNDHKETNDGADANEEDPLNTEVHARAMTMMVNLLRLLHILAAEGVHEMIVLFGWTVRGHVNIVHDVILHLLTLVAEWRKEIHD